MPITSPIPGVGNYASVEELANQAYKNALVKANDSLTTQLGGLGYSATTDPNTGHLTDAHVNPNAQYGSYQQMLRSQAGNYDSIRNSFVGRRVHGGLANQALSQARVGYGSQANDLGQQALGLGQQYNQNLQQAEYEKNAAGWNAQLDALRKAIENGQFNTAGMGGY